MSDDNAPSGTMALALRQVDKLGDLFGIEGGGGDLAEVLIATAFQTTADISPEQMTALCIVAQQYRLNPWTKELYAFPDQHKGIVPIVSVDGWSRIINEHPQMDGMDFTYSESMVIVPDKIGDAEKKAHEWVECTIYRKDRDKPTTIREYFDEVYRPPMGASKKSGPWQSHPKRFHRHKTLIQTARVAFGFAGIYDQDEGERIIEGQATVVDDKPKIERPRAKAERKAGEEIDQSTARAKAARKEKDAAKAEPEEQVVEAEVVENGEAADTSSAAVETEQVEETVERFNEDTGEAEFVPLDQLDDPEWKWHASVDELDRAPAFLGTGPDGGTLYIVFEQDNPPFEWEVGEIGDESRQHRCKTAKDVSDFLNHELALQAPPHEAIAEMARKKPEPEQAKPKTLLDQIDNEDKPAQAKMPTQGDAIAGKASQGMLDFIRAKAREKNIGEDVLIERYSLNKLAEADEAEAGIIIKWLQAQPKPEAGE